MAKRHESLVLLSQDHHHGLALALRLRQGDAALLNDGWTHDRKEQARRVVEFYRDDLMPHFRAEEEVLFPAIDAAIPDGAVLVADLIRQHRRIEELVDLIRQSEQDELEKALIDLGVLLEKHIRVEERELFEMVQSGLTDALLRRIGEDVRRIHESG